MNADDREYLKRIYEIEKREENARIWGVLVSFILFIAFVSGTSC